MDSVTIPGVEPPHRRGTRGPKAAVVFALVLIATLTTVSRLSGESTPTTTEPATSLRTGPITSLGEIAGLYFHVGVGQPLYFLFNQDGTVHISSNKDLVVERPMGVFTTVMDGTEIFITNVRFGFGCPPPDHGGTYEIHVRQGGILQFVAVGRDTCLYRSGMLLGRRFGITAVQLVPL